MSFVLRHLTEEIVWPHLEYCTLYSFGHQKEVVELENVQKIAGGSEEASL